MDLKSGQQKIGYGDKVASIKVRKEQNRKKLKRKDVANEVIAIEKELGIQTDLLVKSNMYSIVGLILILCGLSMPIFIIFGIISEGFSLKVMFSREGKSQNLWHKCVVFYVKGMYNQAKAFCLRLDDEEKNKQAYKTFIKMVDKAIADTAY